VGGIDLGLERAGWECRYQVEIDPYCCKILAKHWPHVKRYGDIRTVNGNELEPVDLICGGFPCQDLSQAGKRAGIEGARSGLWFEFARLVRESRPKYVLVENVPGLLVYDGMRRVIGDLAGCGYVGCWLSLRASDFGASHLRKRIFIVAYRDAGRCEVERFGGLFDGERKTQRDHADGCDPHVAYRELLHSERRGDAGNLGSAAAAEPGEGLQRQRAGNAADDSGDDVAYSGSGFRREARGIIRPELLAKRRRDTEASLSGAGSAEVAYGECLDRRQDIHGRAGERPEDGSGGLLAHGKSGGLGELRQPSECNGFADGSNEELAYSISKGLEIGTGPGEPGGSASPEPEPVCLPAFAPGPSDPRWPAILAARPDLAPALANSTRRVLEPEPWQRQERRTPAGRPNAAVSESGERNTPPQSPLRGMASRIPDWMDRVMSDRTKRLGRLGNSVVPQIAEWIGLKLMEAHKLWQMQ